PIGAGQAFPKRPECAQVGHIIPVTSDIQAFRTGEARLHQVNSVPLGHRRQRGQSTAEVAVSSIVILLLMTGLLDLARVFFYSVDLHAAAREGARHGAWFNTAQRQNQYLYDSEIFSAVNSTLKGAGIKNATLAGGCPGNSPHNTPYPSASYGSPGQTIVYICYDSLG